MKTSRGQRLRRSIVTALVAIGTAAILGGIIGGLLYGIYQGGRP